MIRNSGTANGLSQEEDLLAQKGQETSGMAIHVISSILDEIPGLPGQDIADPLDDNVYTAFHKKMQIHETRMVNQDKLQSESEAERLNAINEDLKSDNWARTLIKTTALKNPDDLQELEAKREQTINAIDQMLMKFNDMKARAMLLPRSGKPRRPVSARKYRVDVYKRAENAFRLNVSSDDEEEGLSLPELKKYRLESQRKKFGGPVIIQCRKGLTTNYKYAIVAEPNQAAYIVKCSKEEKEEWSKKAELLPPKLEYYAQFPKQHYPASCGTRIKGTKMANEWSISAGSSENTDTGLKHEMPPSLQNHSKRAKP